MLGLLPISKTVRKKEFLKADFLLFAGDQTQTCLFSILYSQKQNA